MSEKKVVGLGLELAVVRDAIDAVHTFLVGALDTPAEWSPRRSASAILALTSSRLELLRAVIRGEVDPALVWSEHCATVPEDEAAESDDGEVRLEAWTAKETVERLMEQLERARRRPHEDD